MRSTEAWNVILCGDLKLLVDINGVSAKAEDSRHCTVSTNCLAVETEAVPSSGVACGSLSLVLLVVVWENNFF